MTEGKNPEDKPSFFDFSEEEARSWPPVNSYETEDEEVKASEYQPAQPQAQTEEADIEDLFTSVEDETPKPEETQTQELEIEEDFEIPQSETKYVDMLFTDFGGFDDSELRHDPEQQAEILVPIVKQDEPAEPIIEPSPAPVEIPKAFASDAPNKEEKEALDAILGVQLETKSESNKTDDFDIDSMFVASAKSGDDDDDEEIFTETEAAQDAISDYDISNLIDDDTMALPFRTYSTYDYKDEALTEAALEEAEEKQGLKLNRNVLIVLSVLLLVVGWFGFQSLFTRKVTKQVTGRKRRPPKKELKSIIAINKEMIPVWEITSQKTISQSEEKNLVNDIYKESGRDNPFVVPESVLSDLKRAADAIITKAKAPKTYRRRAYRATLVGVLTSKDNTIALINYQEAVFDILEGTTKAKILQLATKSMDKAKANTQEMVVGSHIGPWQITKMDSPKDAFTEAKVYLQMQGQTKVLTMGRAEELGIFDAGGSIDNLERTGDDSELDAPALPAPDDFEF